MIGSCTGDNVMNAGKEDTKEKNDRAEERVAESFIFLPFKMKAKEDFSGLFSDESRMAAMKWNRSGRSSNVADPDRRKKEKTDSYTDNHYLLKYVADHIEPENLEKCHCFQYELAEDERLLKYPGKGDRHQYNTQIRDKTSSQYKSVYFSIVNIGIYFFSTGIGIVSFLIDFAGADVNDISYALFNLKKAASKSINLGEPYDSRKASFSMLGFAGQATNDFKDRITFFYYSSSTQTYRCSTLSLYEEEPVMNVQLNEKENSESSPNIIKMKNSRENESAAGKSENQENDSSEGEVLHKRYLKDLYYLRNAYPFFIKYELDSDTVKKEIFSVCGDQIWGATAEGSACILTDSANSHGYYVHGFKKTFNLHYLFTFVYVLHQKYALYSFLTSISCEMYGEIGIDQLSDLEQYRKDLSVFEKDFSFSVVSELPQYQIFYEKIRDAFNLEKMYQDVHEPIVELNELERKELARKEKDRELREKEREKKEEKQSKTTEKAINTISYLAIFSALVDCFDLLRQLIYGDEALHPIHAASQGAAWIVLIIAIVSILVFFFWRVGPVFINWVNELRNKRKKSKKNDHSEC